MAAFLLENLSTILIGLALLIVVVFIIIRMRNDHKNGKTSCGCGCGNCPSAGMCHKKQQNAEKSKAEPPECELRFVFLKIYESEEKREWKRYQL